MKRYVMLCEGAFDEDAKTATGVLRYADAVTVAVIDSTRAGSTTADHVPGLRRRRSRSSRPSPRRWPTGPTRC